MSGDRRQRRWGWARSAIALLAAGLTTVLAAWVGSPAEARERPPNVVVVMTDDQTVEQMRAMELTRTRIGEPGASFTSSFVNWPICCPSRATLLTGQYAHNHGVRGNGPPRGGFARLDGASTLPVWLQRRGYHTALVGKYLNGYPGEDLGLVPPGWSEWYAMTGPDADQQRMYDYLLNENGAVVAYGSSVADYKTDVLTERAVELIARRAPRRQPLFLAVMYNAPHIGGPNPNPQPPASCDLGEGVTPPKPAVRHADAFGGEPLPKPPSFNEADVSDKPSAIQGRSPITASSAASSQR